MATTIEQRLGDLLSSRVASLRRREGLSLDGLAERSGLSKGTVVGIENGTANPSIAVLCRLAAGLSVSVSDLIEEHDELTPLTPIERTVPAKLWESANGGAAILQAAITGETMFELWSWTLAPGDRHDSEPHRYGTAELIAVTAGALEITVSEDVVRLTSGETARLRTDQPHSYQAISREPARFTMAVLEKALPATESEETSPS